MIKFFKKLFEGINLVPKTTSTSTSKGDLEVLNTGRLLYNDGTLNDAVVTANSTDTLTNKTIDTDANTIVDIRNANIAANAQIARSKVADGTPYAISVNNASGVLTQSLLSPSAAIVSNANGTPVASSVTATEIATLAGITGVIQTQINTLTNEKVAKAGDTMTGVLDMGANQVTSSFVPNSANVLVNKSYVDSLFENLDPKQSARVATVVPGTLAVSFENGDTIDGIVLATGDRILIKNQAAQAENGIYVVQASGAPARSADANTWDELISAQILSQLGTVNTNTGWHCTISPGGTLGVTAVTFVQQSGVGVITTDGQGIEISGNQLSLELDAASLSKSASGLKINSDLVLTGSSVATVSNTNLALSPDGTGRIITNKELNILTAATGALTNDSSLYVNDTMTLPNTYIVRLTNDSAENLRGITAPVRSQFFILTNAKTNVMVFNNENAGATAANRIITGSGTDLRLASGASLWFYYDTTSSRWRVVGGSGGGGRVTTGTYSAPIEITAVGGITALAGTDQDIYIAGISAEVNVTANPQISPGTLDGQTLRLIGQNNSNYVLLENGTGLVLNGIWLSYAESTLTLRWNNSTGVWMETSRSEL